MKIRLFVDWENERILKEKEYEEEAVEGAKDREEDEYAFAEFLDNYFNRNYGCKSEKLVRLFNLNEEERKEILKLWKKDCLETIMNNLSYDYEEIEIEV